MKKKIILILLSAICLVSWGQEYDLFRQKEISLKDDTIKIDSLSLIENSVILFDSSGNILDNNLYEINWDKSLLIINNKGLKQEKKAKISYRVFPVNFSSEISHKKYLDIYNEREIKKNLEAYNYNKDYEDIFQRNKLDKRGSISRGLSFGNNQDIVVNSNLNLQLSGKISNNLNVKAAVTDNNIPIQPDGNSQQIRDFDKVFISVFNDNINLTVGDFEIKKPSGYFMNLYKKVQGGMFTTNYKLGKENKFKAKNSIAGAVSKGKYNRMKIEAVEGVQGPYKLKGANLEKYIVVLSGTEKIYIDGRLLKRGLNNDYIIDYNTAEITFTPNTQITKDKRIIAEFEYSDKNYARFTIFNSNEFVKNENRFYLNIYSEQDSKNQTLQQDLDKDDKNLLSEIGDNISQAIVPNVDSVEFNNSMVLYKITDTTVSGITYDSIYVYSSNPDSAFYRLGFSDVGQGNGNYIQTQSSANGKVFKWVAPENGSASGKYEPVILLITPRKKQMLTAGGDIKITKSTKANMEFSLTNNDINTFSEKDRSDNKGYAVKMGLKQAILNQDSGKTVLNTSLNYNYITNNFNEIERFRTTEFERDWNLNKDFKIDEHYLDFNVDFLKEKIGFAKYKLEFLEYYNAYNALKNNLNSELNAAGFKLKLNGSILQSKNNISSTNFIRSKAGLSKRISIFDIGIRHEQEINEWKDINNDSLLGNSFSYNQTDFYIQNSDSSKNIYSLNYKIRNDFLSDDNKLSQSSSGRDLSFNMFLKNNPKHTFRSIITYRELSIQDSSLTDQEKENTVTGRIEHNLRLFRNSLSSSIFYETATGMEKKKEYSYLEVAAGQGTYTWSDYNNNNIKELNEFEVANFADEANYIRIFTPTESYIKVLSNQFSQRLNFSPGKLFESPTKIQKFISRFSNRFIYRLNQKTKNRDRLSGANPFDINNLNDSTLITMGASIKNNLSFNKRNSVYGINYIYRMNKNKNQLTNGIESRSYIYNTIQFRWNINNSLTILDDIKNAVKTYNSEYFEEKNYLINTISNNGTIRFQPSIRFRINLNYEYSEKSNAEDFQKAYINNTGLEFKYNKVKKGNILLTISYINIKYNDDVNSSISYEMLEGFKPGHNGSWSVMYKQNLSKSLQMSINYNGRASENSKIIHLASVQLRAYF